MANHDMETLSQATARLQALGYTGNWIAQPGGTLHCSQCKTDLDAATLTIDEIVRFEGDSDPGDEAILYALTGPCGDRGLYSSSYGPDSTTADIDVARRLR